MKKNILIAICLLISSTVLAGPGLKLVTQSQTSASGNKAESIIYINDSQMVMETKQGGDFTMMYDAAKEEIVIVDHRKKQYSSLGKKELSELSETLNSMKGLIKAFYANMPPETQKKFAPLINGKDPNITFSAKGSAKVNSWNTTKYQVSGSNSKALFDMNIADFNSMGINQADVAAIRKLSVMLNKYLPGIEAFIPGASIFSDLNNERNPMFTKGIPVKTIAYDENGSVADQFWVTKAEKSNFTLADFKVPAGYTKTDIKLDNPMQK
ncbi:MAG: hypothetical protein AAFQ94_10020 [Bacteroidota bacterium]